MAQYSANPFRCRGHQTYLAREVTPFTYATSARRCTGQPNLTAYRREGRAQSTLCSCDSKC